MKDLQTIKKLGLKGAAIGTAVSVILGNIIATNIYYIRVIKLNVVRMYKEIFERTIWCVLLAAVISSFTRLIHINLLVDFLIHCSTFVLVYGISMWFYGANENEKRKFMSMINVLGRRLA